MIPRQESDHPIDRIRFGLMVAIGGEDSSETLELVKKQEQIARREMTEVPQRAEARGTEFLEYSAESRERLIGHMEKYLTWLVKARTGLEESDTGTIMEAHEESSEILPELNAAMEKYSHDFSSFGPFQSMPANTLLRTAEGLETKQLPQEAWAEYCEYFRKGIADRLDSLEQLELPGKTLLKSSYSDSIKALQALKPTPPESKAQASEKLQSFDKSYAVAEKLEKSMATASEAGSTAIPATNVLLELLNQQEELGEEAVLGIVEDYGEIMDGYAEAFEDSASRPTDSALVQEEIPRTLDSLDAHYAAIEELGEVLEEGETDKIPELLEKLKSSAGALKESQEVFETASKHQTSIACPSCGRANPPENRNCEACGEILPRAEDAGLSNSSTFSVLSGPALEENQQLEMTENVAELFQSCDDVADGVITPDQFQAILVSAAKDFQEFVDELDGVAAMALDESNFTPEQFEIWKTQHLPYMEDVAVTYQAGIQEVQEGLQSMEQFLADPDRAHLVEGIRLTWQGLSTINRGRLSFEAHYKMLCDVIEEAQEEGLISGE